MWKVSQNPSDPNFETCKTCHTKYPECTTCKNYGRKTHQIDIEKNKGSHDNPAYKNDEQVDPRSKIW
jgi:hypothetical protein